MINSIQNILKHKKCQIYKKPQEAAYKYSKIKPQINIIKMKHYIFITIVTSKQCNGLNHVLR